MKGETISAPLRSCMYARLSSLFSPSLPRFPRTTHPPFVSLFPRIPRVNAVRPQTHHASRPPPEEAACSRPRTRMLSVCAPLPFPLLSRCRAHNHEWYGGVGRARVCNAARRTGKRRRKVKERDSCRVPDYAETGFWTWDHTLAHETRCDVLSDRICCLLLPACLPACWRRIFLALTAKEKESGVFSFISIRCSTTRNRRNPSPRRTGPSVL